MPVIFLPTIQHTGTWFLIELLRNHTGVDYFIEEKELPVTKHRKGTVLLQIHFSTTEGWQEEILVACKAIIPVRDPLLALISRQVRHPEKDHIGIIDGFLTLVEWYRKYGKKQIFTFPIDLAVTMSANERFQLIQSAIAFVDLVDDDIDWARQVHWAYKWPIINTIGTAGDVLLGFYKTGVVTSIADTMPEEYEYLKSKEGILKPFLQEIGYQNLPWWTV